jgi:hypothetical protein
MAATVSVLIPWYETNDPYRYRALQQVLCWWEAHHPLWDVHVGKCTEADGGWRKGLAVHRALQQSTGQICVVSDADVICPAVGIAIDQVESLRSAWAVPHRRVHRMTEPATTIMIDSGVYPRVPWPEGSIERSYQGIPGGGLIVLSRNLLTSVPIDPRFVGWGQEDMSWGHALTMIAGYPWRGDSPLFHLWHPPQGHSSTRRGVGSEAGYALWQRYQGAVTLPMMLDLVGEARRSLTDMGLVP